MSLVTIIIPSFNSHNYISDCLSNIKSAIPELLNDGTVSVLIKDGVSTDGSVEIIKQNQKKYSWIDAAFMADSSVYQAMNQAVEICESKWIYFLGADDLILPEFSKIIPHLLEDQYSKKIHYCNVELTSGGIYDGAFSQLKMVRKNICHQAIFYPTEMLRNTPFPLEYRSLGDWALNLKLFSFFIYHGYVVAQYNDITGLSKEYRDSAFVKDKPLIVLQSFGRLYYFLAIMYKMIGILKNAIR
ncbi:glycosyltransferase [Kosakonia sacchari]|uniref:glycosyltransferase n=1 Tax=Kosakonia sacchari TaxID=1158459 RepID=UPI002ACD5F34|nr:glycosyltransferase [Kosakonia sacchari]MDZ7320184.1 glycosyltransferase [Kosakonia sacchari]